MSSILAFSQGPAKTPTQLLKLVSARSSAADLINRQKSFWDTTQRSFLGSSTATSFPLDLYLKAVASTLEKRKLNCDDCPADLNKSSHHGPSEVGASSYIARHERQPLCQPALCKAPPPAWRRQQVV